VFFHVFVFVLCLFVYLFDCFIAVVNYYAFYTVLVDVIDYFLSLIGTVAND